MPKVIGVQDEPALSFSNTANAVLFDENLTVNSFGVESTTTPSTNIPIDPNILWGAGAAAVLGMTLAEWARIREEERQRREREEQKAENQRRRLAQLEAQQQAAQSAAQDNRNDYMENKMDRIDAADEAEYNRVQSVLAQRELEQQQTYDRFRQGEWAEGAQLIEINAPISSSATSLKHPFQTEISVFSAVGDIAQGVFFATLSILALIITFEAVGPYALITAPIFLTMAIVGAQQFVNGFQTLRKMKDPSINPTGREVIDFFFPFLRN